MSQTRTSLADLVADCAGRALRHLLEPLSPALLVSSTQEDAQHWVDVLNANPDRAILLGRISNYVPGTILQDEAALKQEMQEFAETLLQENKRLAPPPHPLRTPGVVSVSACRGVNGSGVRVTHYFDTQLGLERVRFDVIVIEPDPPTPDSP